MTHAAASVSGAVTVGFALLLVAMILCLAFEEKLHAKKSVIVAVFAMVCLLLGGLLDLLPFADMVVVVGEEHIELPIYIPAINWEVVAIILGSSLFVDITSKSGLFTRIAIVLTKTSRGDPLRLLIYYGVMTVVFSAVLNNVTAMIIVGSLTAVSLSRLGIGDKLLGFLLVEGFLTNVGGLLTLISSVPNIIVGNAAGITFATFFVKAAPYVVVVTGITIWLGAKLFEIRPLASDEARSEAARLVSGFDENDGITSRFKFNFGAVMLGAFIVTIASASIPGTVLNSLGMGYVALSFAVIMLVQYRSIADRFYQAVDWDLLAFFSALFIVINVMEHAQVLAMIGRGLAPILELGATVGPATMLLSSALASSVTDNIPLAAMLAKILGNLDLAADSPYWWSVIFGANLGGNITPIGSASTLVAVTIIHKHNLELSFLGFVRVALPFAALQLVLAAVYVLWIL
ncbi:MAG: SLC13 family permease [Gammaproteobacteria bacterium]|nr:SLC13 family permease [Gammaproteobacteria bacterium]